MQRTDRGSDQTNLAGFPADMAEVLDLVARQQDLRVIQREGGK